MEAQGRDGGDATSPLLVAEHRNLSVADGAGVVQASGDDSPATAFLVLSIAVAVCGSYTYGFAVSCTASLYARVSTTTHIKYRMANL